MAIKTNAQKGEKEISLIIVGVVVALFIVATLIYISLMGMNDKELEIKSFDDCVNAGYPVMESYPMQCRADGVTFTEESCQSNGNILTLSDARQIAINSECGDRLRGTYFCNENTGTYWIDLNIERRGCNPACVIDIETRGTSINWRCTGLIR